MSELSPEAVAYRDAQTAEYSAYVATEQIFIDGALAFNVDDPVPAGHVKRGVVAKEQVAKPDTKAGQEAQADNPTSPKGEKA
jgi:hypothetical protein